MRDAIGRAWQRGTIQLDFNLPERLERSTSARTAKHRPVMLHRAISAPWSASSASHRAHAGAFPLWLAPVQIVLVTITADADAYAR